MDERSVPGKGGVLPGGEIKNAGEDPAQHIGGQAMSFGLFLTIVGAGTLACGIMKVVELLDDPAEGRRHE